VEVGFGGPTHPSKRLQRLCDWSFNFISSATPGSLILSYLYALVAGL
jgi:hypothetical protein